MKKFIQYIFIFSLFFLTPFFFEKSLFTSHAQMNPFMRGGGSSLQNNDVFYNYVGDVRCKTKRETDSRGNVVITYYDCESSTSSLENTSQINQESNLGNQTTSSIEMVKPLDSSFSPNDVVCLKTENRKIVKMDSTGNEVEVVESFCVEYKTTKSALNATKSLDIADTILSQRIDNPEDAFLNTCPKSFKNITELFQYVICLVSNGLIPLIMTIAVLLFFYGIARFISAGDNSEQIKVGRTYIFWGIVAIFVMVSLWGIIGLATGTLIGGSPQVPQLQQSYKKIK